jgi:8-oxo-dGTP pyrophosphatase MutT (NUDIX family)
VSSVSQPRQPNRPEMESRPQSVPGTADATSGVTPVPSATAILLHGDPFEVLMIRRVRRSSFAGGLWVFPGGALDPADRAMAAGDDPLLPFAICALRELFEETGILPGGAAGAAARAEVRERPGRFASLLPDVSVAAASLVPTARWITPVVLPKRFDTWFFLAVSPERAEPVPDESECDDAVWITPAEALDRFRAGSFPLMYPTIKTLESLAGHRSVEELVSSRRGAVIEPILPVIPPGHDANGNRIVMPEKSE